MLVWEVEYTDQFGQWWNGLTAEEQKPIIANVELLVAQGPGLGRPSVDTIAGSRHANMKELRIGTTRVFFAFDPRRTAILMIAGDKRGRWKEFYERMIPMADDVHANTWRSCERKDSCPMPKTKPFRELVERAYEKNPGMREDVAVIKQAMEDVLELEEIRKRRGLTQVQVADRLGITQGNVSQLEHRTELYLSTLREYVEALGGRLKLTAVFPDEECPVAVAGGGSERRHSKKR